MGAFGEPRDARLYRRMRFIRRFEETVLALFEEGLLNGTTHACIGQEADSVGLMEHLRDGRPPLLQPPLPRALPRLDRRCLRPARGDHGQARGTLRGDRRQPAHLRAGLQVQRSPGRDRARGSRHRPRRAAQGIRRPERRLPRRRHARRRHRVRDAQPDGPVATAAAARGRGQRLVAEHAEQPQPGGRHRGAIQRVRRAGRRSRHHRRARDRGGGRRGGRRVSREAGSRRARHPYLPPLPSLEERRPQAGRGGPAAVGVRPAGPARGAPGRGRAECDRQGGRGCPGGLRDLGDGSCDLRARARRHVAPHAGGGSPRGRCSARTSSTRTGAPSRSRAD